MPDPLLERMRADGVCRYGDSAEEWTRTWRARALHNPPALLGALDFEWIAPEEAASWRAPEYWSPEHRFEPFGRNGAGDLFALYPRFGNAVVLAAHDVNECRVLAPNLEGFLYREMLEALTYEYDRDDGFTEAEKGQALRANLETLRPYLRARWLADLEAIAARPYKDWVLELPRLRDPHRSRMDAKELEARIAGELAFEQLDEVFRHMRA